MELKVEWQSNQALVGLNGNLDRETVPRVRKKLLGMVRRTKEIDLILDFSNVSAMDSAGVAVLVELLRAVSERDGTLRLRHLNERSKNMIRLARLAEVFEIENGHKTGLLK